MRQGRATKNEYLSSSRFEQTKTLSFSYLVGSDVPCCSTSCFGFGFVGIDEEHCVLLSA
jgi:hypothetical protein